MSYKLKHEPTINIERFESMIISDECFAEELCIDWRLDERGAKQYADIMRRNLGEQIFYVIDGVVVAAPNVGGIVKTGQGQFPIRKIDFDSLFVKKK
jgi:preprotein translocase subunit SecD